MPFELVFGKHAVSTIVVRITKFGSKQSTPAQRIFQPHQTNMRYKIRAHFSNLSAPFLRPSKGTQTLPARQKDTASKPLDVKTTYHGMKLDQLSDWRLNHFD